MSIIKTIHKGLECMHFQKDILDVGSSSVKLASTVDSYSKPAATAAQALSLVGSFYTVFEGVESAHTLATKVKKKNWKTIDYLETFHATLTLIAGGIAIARIDDLIKIIQNSNIVNSTGTVSVTSTAIGQAAGALGIVKVTTEIGILAFQLHQVNKKIKHTKAKTSLWHEPIDRKFIAVKITHTDEKNKDLIKTQTAAKEALSELKYKVHQKSESVANKRAILKEKKPIRKLYAWIDLKKAKSTHKKLSKNEQKKLEELDQINKKVEQRIKKIQSWQAIDNKIAKGVLAPEEMDKLQQLQRDKQAKWTVKKNNLKVEKLKLSLSMGLKCTLLVVLIASFTLSTIGMSSSPAMITLSSIAIFLAVAGLGLSIYDMRKKPKSVPAASILSLQP